MAVKKSFSIMLILLAAVFLHSERLIKADNPPNDLQSEFENAFNKGKSSGGFWIGYSIQKNYGSQILIGSFYYGDNYDLISLREIILNKEFNASQPKTKKKRTGKTFRISNGISIGDKSEDKETAILFRYDENSESINDFDEISICSLSRYFDLQGCPLTWLGERNNKTSIDFIFSLYKKAGSISSKEELIPAVGVHSGQPEVTKFLSNILMSKANDDFREDISFWLGLQNNSEAFTVLKEVIENDRSKDVREHAVMGLSYIELPIAMDELINIARHNINRDIRKQAVNALGNKAAKKAEEALKNIVEDDPDIEIKKRAVYALANNSDDNIPYLIKLAKTHPSLTIRKSAIWALGDSDDERALEALIELAEN